MRSCNGRIGLCRLVQLTSIYLWKSGLVSVFFGVCHCESMNESRRLGVFGFFLTFIKYHLCIFARNLAEFGQMLGNVGYK